MSGDDRAGGTICNDRQVIAPCSWGPGGALSPREALEILHFTAPKMDEKQVLFYLLQAYFFLKFWLSLKKREMPEKNIEDCASRR